MQRWAAWNPTPEGIWSDYCSREVLVRVPLIIGALVVSVPAASQPDAPGGTSSVQPKTSAVGARVSTVRNDECRHTRAYLAKSKSVWTGEALRPKKLDELPPGTAYMAVHRTINGCEVPLKAAEYRKSAGAE